MRKNLKTLINYFVAMAISMETKFAFATLAHGKAKKANTYKKSN
jgi:hypothetical protein